MAAGHRRGPEEEIFGWGGIGFPLVLTQFIGFFIFLIATQAEMTRPPFDMPVAEAELMTGYMVEYTGIRFLFLFMAEYITMFGLRRLRRHHVPGRLVGPWVDGGMADVLGPFVLFAKTG